MTAYLPVLIVTAIAGLLLFYLSKRLIRRDWHWALRGVLWLSFCLGLVILPLMALKSQWFFSLPAQLREGVALAFGWVTLLLGFALVRECLMAVWHLGEFFYTLWQKRGGRLQSFESFHQQQQRRDFMRHASQWGVYAASVGVFGRAALDVQDMSPTVVRVEVPIKNLPEALDGVSIVQISDMHIGQIRHEKRLVAQVVEQVNQLNADVVVYTGDMIDGSVAQLAERVRPLTQVQARYGRFMVTGNHEYYSDRVERWIAFWQQAGVHVLQNQHQVLSINGANLVMAGVNDLKAQRRGGLQSQALECNPVAAVQGAPDAPTILLAHHPDVAKLTHHLRVDLQLSGHTHGGQYFPGTYLYRLVHSFKVGLNPQAGRWVYVNSGTGYWGPALRTTDVLSEITLLILKRAV